MRLQQVQLSAKVASVFGTATKKLSDELYDNPAEVDISVGVAERVYSASETSMTKKTVLQVTAYRNLPIKICQLAGLKKTTASRLDFLIENKYLKRNKSDNESLK